MAASGGAKESLNEMLAGRAGSGTPPAARPAPGAKGRPNKKKKGGRVTPPKGR
jgi:hypothetical protein